MAAPIGSPAGPHGAIVLGYGPKAPAARPGFRTVGTGRGGWIGIPLAAPKAAKPAAKPAPQPLIPANSPLLNPNTTLSGSSLLQAAQGLANAQTLGPISELASQIAENNRQSQGAINQVGGFYNQLGGQAQQGVTDEQNLANGLNSRLQGIGTDEQSALQGIGQNATSSLLKYAPQSDSSNSLANPALQSLSTEIARQQGLAAQDQGAFRAFGATQGANYGSAAASNLGTFALGGQEALKNIAQNAQVKNEPLNAKIAALRATQGADLATAVGKLRQQEIANKFTSQGLNIRQQANTIAQQNNLANQGLKQQGINISAASQQETARHDKAAEALSAANNAANNAVRLAIANRSKSGGGGGGGGSRGGGGGGGGASPSQARTITGQIGSISGLVNQLEGYGQSPTQAYHTLQNGGYAVVGKHPDGTKIYKYFPPVGNTQLLNAGYNLSHGQHGLSSGDVAALRNMGITNPGAYGLRVQPGSVRQGVGGSLGSLGSLSASG